MYVTGMGEREKGLQQGLDILIFLSSISFTALIHGQYKYYLTYAKNYNRLCAGGDSGNYVHALHIFQYTSTTEQVKIQKLT